MCKWRCQFPYVIREKQNSMKYPQQGSFVFTSYDLSALFYRVHKKMCHALYIGTFSKRSLCTKHVTANGHPYIYILSEQNTMYSESCNIYVVLYWGVVGGGPASLYIFICRVDFDPLGKFSGCFLHCFWSSTVFHQRLLKIVGQLLPKNPSFKLSLTWKLLFITEAWDRRGFPLPLSCS